MPYDPMQLAAQGIDPLTGQPVTQPNTRLAPGMYAGQPGQPISGNGMYGTSDMKVQGSPQTSAYQKYLAQALMQSGIPSQ